MKNYGFLGIYRLVIDFLGLNQRNHIRWPEKDFSTYLRTSDDKIINLIPLAHN